jgi:putative colanic acid biosynthesis acetyltransferase WcaF
MKQTDLSKYNLGAGKIKIALWYIVNALFLINPLNPFGKLKVFLLRLFGAKIGKGVVIKQGVNIKYPWLLSIGDYTWVGERVWIDNLAQVTIGKNCCLSQGAMLLCGNHNYKKETFDLITGAITIEDGAWVGALSIVCPGVTLKTHAILSVSSVATETLEAYTMYKGNPAQKVRERVVL